MAVKGLTRTHSSSVIAAPRTWETSLVTQCQNLERTNATNTCQCNCRVKQNCLLNRKCLTTCIVYKAEINTNYDL